MSPFDQRWRRLASTAGRAPEPPMPALPRLEFLAQSRRSARRWEPLALRIAVALGAAAYALAAWLLPVAIDDSHPPALASLPSPPHPPVLALPRPPRLPPPEQVLADLAAAADSLTVDSLTRAATATDGHSL